MKLPQLHIRDLFWLVTVVALLCGWWFQQGQVAEARRQLGQAQLGQQNAERIEVGYRKIIDAYVRDGRLHYDHRADGSIVITDKPPVITGGFGTPGP